MPLRLVQVNIKAVDHTAVGRFWAAALGWDLHSRRTTYVAPPGDFVWPDPVAIGINIVPVPDHRNAVKNRVHLDLATASPADLVARLRDLGALVEQGDAQWAVLADPEGNEFCVRVSSGGTGPIARIVVDCADPPAMARFWSSAVDWTVVSVTSDEATLRSAAGRPDLAFVRTPDAAGVTGRIHLDLLPYPGDDKAAEVDRLRALGAADLDIGQGDVPWTCLTDPEGHEFCVLALP